VYITGRVHPTEGLTFAVEMNAQSSYFADEPNLIRFGGRSVFNLLANYNIKTSWGGISAFARGDNVLNRFYFNLQKKSCAAMVLGAKYEKNKK